VPGGVHDTGARQARSCVLALTATDADGAAIASAGNHDGGISPGAVEVPATVSRQPHLFTVPGRVRMVPATANGQPAFAAGLRERGGVYDAHVVMVLSTTPAGIAGVVIFPGPGLFGLPQEHGGDAAGPAPQYLAVPPWPR
jgi:hypothetical protein